MAPPLSEKESFPQRDRPKATSEEGLSLLRLVARKNRLVLIFCVLALVAVAANAKLVLDVSSAIAGHEAPSTVSQPPGVQPKTAHAADIAASLRNRISVFLGIVVACLGTMGYLLVSRLFFPLHAIAKAADEMANGNLSVTAPAHHGDEVGELGHIINNLAVNFQEILLLTGTAVGSSCAAVERIQRILEQDGNLDTHDMKEQVTVLKKDLEMLGTVVRDFQFYQTRFDGQKVVSTGSRTEG